MKTENCKFEIPTMKIMSQTDGTVDWISQPEKAREQALADVKAAAEKMVHAAGLIGESSLTMADRQRLFNDIRLEQIALMTSLSRLYVAEGDLAVLKEAMTKNWAQ